jgi:dihydrofolate reductase
MTTKMKKNLRNHVYIATSLDGFIARSDGSLDWLVNFPNPAGTDYGYSEFMSQIDVIVMGRKTYQTVLAFETWPYEQPVVVLSCNQLEIPNALQGKVSHYSGALHKLCADLEQKSYLNAYIDGGATITSFLKEDLMDEITISRLPILLGDGIPLFSTSNVQLDFDHVHTTAFANGLIKSHYRRAMQQS